MSTRITRLLLLAALIAPVSLLAANAVLLDPTYSQLATPERGTYSGSIYAFNDSIPASGSFDVPGLGSIYVDLAEGSNGVWSGSIGLLIDGVTGYQDSLNLGFFGGSAYPYGSTSGVSQYMDMTEEGAAHPDGSYSLYTVRAGWQMVDVPDPLPGAPEATGSWSLTWDDPVVQPPGVVTVPEPPLDLLHIGVTLIGLLLVGAWVKGSDLT